MSADASGRCPVCGGSLEDATNGACVACGLALGARPEATAKAAGPLTRREIRLEIADLRRQLDVAPTAADVWHEMGIHYERLFLLRDAENAYLEALYQMPENVLVRIDLTSLLTARAAGGDHGAAIAAGEQARLLLRLDDDPAPGRLILAQLAVQKRDYAAARAEIHAATTLDPRDCGRRLTWIDLAEATDLFTIERSGDAVAIWRRVAPAAPDSTRATVLAELSHRRSRTLAAARRQRLPPVPGSPGRLVTRLDWEDREPVLAKSTSSGLLARSDVRWWIHLLWMLVFTILGAYLAAVSETPWAFIAVLMFVYLPGARWLYVISTRSDRAVARRRRDQPDDGVGILARLEDPDTPIEALLAVAERVGRAEAADALRVRVAWQDNQSVALPTPPAVGTRNARRSSG